MMTAAPVRITTMCVGRICVGYRASSPSATSPDYVAVVSVFISVFVVVWAALVVLLVVRCRASPAKTARRRRLRPNAPRVPRLALPNTPQLGEVLRPSSSISMSGIQSAHSQERARDQLIKEILRRRMEVDDLCPIEVRGHDDLLDSTCAVCLDTVACGDLQRTLLCGHNFHSSCIDRWFMQMCDARYGGVAPNCPVCKQKLGATAVHAARPPPPPPTPARAAIQALSASGHAEPPVIPLSV
jgi:hypothetical protein